jgi:hypothetical protein
MASRVPKEVKLEKVTAWLPATEAVWKVALFTSLSNCNTDGVSTYAQCLADGHEIVGTGYTAGGATLAGRAVGYTDGTNAYLNATDASWTTATLANVRYAVVYETAGSKIRGVYDLTSDYSVTNGAFTLTWDAVGLLKVK